MVCANTPSLTDENPDWATEHSVWMEHTKADNWLGWLLEQDEKHVATAISNYERSGLLALTCAQNKDYEVRPWPCLFPDT